MMMNVEDDFGCAIEIAVETENFAKVAQDAVHSFKNKPVKKATPRSQAKLKRNARSVPKLPDPITL